MADEGPVLRLASSKWLILEERGESKRPLAIINYDPCEGEMENVAFQVLIGWKQETAASLQEKLKRKEIILNKQRLPYFTIH